MNRNLTDLSTKTLGDIREMKSHICASLRNAIIEAVNHEESAYGIRLADISVDFGRKSFETECGEIIASSIFCNVDIDIIGTEL